MQQLAAQLHSFLHQLIFLSITFSTHMVPHINKDRGPSSLRDLLPLLLLQRQQKPEGEWRPQTDAAHVQQVRDWCGGGLDGVVGPR